MALALFGFSMTTLYPVHYLYYDVLLLLISAALAEAFDAPQARPVFMPWAVSLTVLAALVFLVLRTETAPFPHVAAGAPAPDAPLRAGFAASESDGEHEFSWIVGNDARIVLPRGSTAAADIVIAAQSPFSSHQPPQRMTVILNGTLVAETIVPAGWHEIRIPTARSSWWIGFNELRLLFSSTVSLRDEGTGDDPRALALGVSRVDVVRQGPP